MDCAMRTHNVLSRDHAFYNNYDFEFYYERSSGFNNNGY